MTDRNELERLLAAATEGPWAVYGPPNSQIIWSVPESRVAFMAHSDGCDVECDKATAALIVHLVNNAQHYLSLMDEVERLRGELGWAIETLREINPSNYDHDDVCALNYASVEVILGLQKALGETK